MKKETKHIQLNHDDFDDALLDYDLILRPDDKGTKYIIFDIYDYKNKDYIFSTKIDRRSNEKI
jgi:hypothetical protein|tara:strand:- start:246 stop:434 length:189 start_codon:yes stop_codon:yes gene_type:complete